VYNSLHAAELLDGSNKHAQAVFERADTAYLSILSELIREADGAGELALPKGAKAKEAARMLFYAAEGIVRRARTASELERLLQHLGTWMLRRRD
jgi:hypothetical protein